MQDEWYEFSDEPCLIDFSREEQELYRARYTEWDNGNALDDGMANAPGGMVDGWIEDEGFEAAMQKFEQLRHLY